MPPREILAANPLYYSDNTGIELCEASLQSLRTIYDNNFVVGRRLPIDVVKMNRNFRVLATIWLGPCRELMGYQGLEYEKLFSEDNDIWDEAYSEKFLEDFMNFLTGAENGTDPLWFDTSRRDMRKLCNEIDERLTSVSEGMRLRIKCICLLMPGGAQSPEDIFESGRNWYVPFLAGTAQDDSVPLSDGMELDLSYQEPVEKLYPRTLRNETAQPIRFTVNFHGERYPVWLPPKGFLRAVFADAEGKRLLSIKGNISVGVLGSDNVLVQRRENDVEALVFCGENECGSIDLNGGLLRDAAVDGDYALVLTDRMLFNNGDPDNTRTQELPIRLYAAGAKHARQYDDGRLEGNLYFDRNQRAEYAVAVAEEDGRTLLIRVREHAYRFVGLEAREISDEEFVSAMMVRFQTDSYCEQVKTDWTEVTVSRNGNISRRDL